jgi:exodeoxyribonuclease V gamma subunit
MQSPAARTNLPPGFCIIHGNHLEILTDLLVQWLGQYPLQPLEPELFLVQSNGMAQWLKLAVARDDATGIAAAQRFDMPATFLWQAYRTVLGDTQVPQTSPYDKSRLTWRLMRLLPGLMAQPDFQPLKRFLSDDQDQRKRFQLSERLADLFDQYQVYRADWLAAWEAGEDRIFRSPTEQHQPLGEQRWQAALWRALIDDMPAHAKLLSRAHLHGQFCQALQSATAAPDGLPARIVVFGLSSLPQQMLEALHELSRHSQILLLVLNPCQHYWGDIIEERELVRHQQQRHTTKATLQNIPQAARHRQANPLLASWGKQGRDYIGLLYSYDLPEHYAERFQEIDLFEPPQGSHLLGDLQRSIFHLDGVPEAPVSRDADESIRFHTAHSPQREVEILHDQLLHRFETAAAEGNALQPRDVIVMVPDIESYAPHIEAVFGSRTHNDPDFLPFSISITACAISSRWRRRWNCC